MSNSTRMVEAPGHPSNYEGEMELTCNVCGGTYEVPATISLSRQCRAKCPSCKD